MSVKLNLIAAACENLGIGKNGDLPWKLAKEYAYFERMTAAKKDKTKKNVMIMGRLTLESFPKIPGPDKICLVLSKSDLDVSKYKNAYVCKSFEEAIDALENNEKFRDIYENVWVVGGSSVYKQAMESDKFYRLYLTTILENYECDTFFPTLPTGLRKVSAPDVPDQIQEENGIRYTFNIYEK